MKRVERRIREVEERLRATRDPVAQRRLLSRLIALQHRRAVEELRGLTGMSELFREREVR